MRDQGRDLRDQGRDMRDQGRDMRDQGRDMRDQGRDMRDQGRDMRDQGRDMRDQGRDMRDQGRDMRDQGRDWRDQGRDWRDQGRSSCLSLICISSVQLQCLGTVSNELPPLIHPITSGAPHMNLLYKSASSLSRPSCFNVFERLACITTVYVLQSSLSLLNR